MKIHVPIINRYSLCIFRQANVSFASRLMEAISYIDTLIILKQIRITNAKMKIIYMSIISVISWWMKPE
jgi:hypothetical protein